MKLRTVNFGQETGQRLRGRAGRRATSFSYRNVYVDPRSSACVTLSNAVKMHNAFFDSLGSVTNRNSHAVLDRNRAHQRPAIDQGLVDCCRTMLDPPRLFMPINPELFVTHELGIGIKKLKDSFPQNRIRADRCHVCVTHADFDSLDIHG